MRITRPTPASLEIRNTPWAVWAISVLWDVIGLGLLGAQLGLFDELGSGGGLLNEAVARDPMAIAVALVMIVSGLAIFVLIADTTWTFADGALTVRQARLIGARTQTYRLHELRHAELQRTTKGSTRVAIVRESAPDITLTSFYTGGGGARKREAVEAINALLRR